MSSIASGLSVIHFTASFGAVSPGDGIQNFFLWKPEPRPVCRYQALISSFQRSCRLWFNGKYLNLGQKGNDGLYSILGGLNYYVCGDDLKLMVDYIHTWSDFRQANPEFGEDQFDEVIGRIQWMF